MRTKRIIVYLMSFTLTMIIACGGGGGSASTTSVTQTTTVTPTTSVAVESKDQFLPLSIGNKWIYKVKVDDKKTVNEFTYTLEITTVSENKYLDKNQENFLEAEFIKKILSPLFSLEGLLKFCP